MWLAAAGTVHGFLQVSTAGTHHYSTPVLCSRCEMLCCHALFYDTVIRAFQNIVSLAAVYAHS